MNVIEPAQQCPDCGGEISSGPFGPRCLRCVMSLLAEPEADGVLDVDDLFPELVLEEMVARGGFGTVFRAEHRQMKRPVALKFLDTLLARSPEAVELFRREMVTVGGLDHPGIVRAHDAGGRDGHWYIVMEFVEGADCGALVRKHGVLPIAESCEIIRQAALALHYAHGKGLVHRDVKPGNIMIAGTAPPPSALIPQVPALHSQPLTAGPPPTVKLLDFGLASIEIAPLLDNPGAVPADSPGDRFLGTLEYVAPEQIENPAKVDARADIYALGATLRRFLTGKPAREGRSEQTLLLRMQDIVSTPVPPIASLRPDLPQPLAALCDRLVAMDRDLRPATAEEAAALLAPWCAGAELVRLFTDGPLPEQPFVAVKKNRRVLRIVAIVAAAAVVFAMAALVLREPMLPQKPYRPLFSAKYFQARQTSADSGPRIYSNAWEVESEVFDTTYKQFGRLAPDGSIYSLDRGLDDPIRRWDGRSTTAALMLKSGRPDITALGVAPEGHLVWAMPKDGAGLHIGRAKPDGTVLPPLRYDFSGDFPLGLYEFGRQIALRNGMAVGDGEPRGFAFVTADNVPPRTGLRAGDVIVADFGQRVLLEIGAEAQYKSKPGLWRFRLDDDAPARRLATAQPQQMLIDATVSKHGVFAIDMIWDLPEKTPTGDPRQLTDHLLRWDEAGWKACALDKPLLNPTGLAADPLSGDLYVLCGDGAVSLGSDRHGVQRLVPAGPDRYTLQPFVSHLGRAGPGGIAFSPDGRQLIITDDGSRAIVVLRRTY